MDEPRYHLQGVVRSRPDVMEDFNGPLDVILLLLSKNRIEIADISIASILEQYLSYLEEMKRMDMEITSEFITMASHLMLIKTKMLLSASEQAEAESEMEQLRQSLLQRQRQEILEELRKGMEFLEQRNDIGRGLFIKGPEPLKKQRDYQYQHLPEDLIQALIGIAERSQKLIPPPASSFHGIVGKEPFPVTVKAKEIIGKLAGQRVLHWRQLFLSCRSRTEVVATFLAVLELCRNDSILIYDDGTGYDPELELIRTPEEALRKETD